jgi:hypothetical protein
MDEAQRRHALTLNEAHDYFGGYEGLTAPERGERLRYVRLRDGSRRPDATALEAMALDQIRRRAE